MRHISVVAGIAIAVTVVALLSARVITADTSDAVRAVRAPVSIDVMGMMRDARNLPVEQFEAI